MEEQGHIKNKQTTPKQNPPKLMSGIFYENKLILLVYWIKLSVTSMKLERD